MIYLEDCNTVHLKGTIATVPVYSHSVYGEGFYETLLEVARLSEHKDMIPITISERLIADGALNVGSVITVNGQFRSYNKVVDDKSKLMLTVFVREVLPDSDHNPNTISLKGFICKPPIYRTTPFKREICDLLLAVNRAYNKSDYIPCIAWGRNARFIQSFKVGDKVTIQGRIQSREYQKRIAEDVFETRTAYEVSIGRISIDTPTSQPYGQMEPIVYDTLN